MIVAQFTVCKVQLYISSHGGILGHWMNPLYIMQILPLLNWGHVGNRQVSSGFQMAPRAGLLMVLFLKQSTPGVMTLYIYPY